MNANQVEMIDEWLRAVLWENELPEDTKPEKTPFEIHRMKGRIVLKDGDQKMIQGVREVFEIVDSPSVDADEGRPSAGKVVLIGRHLRDFDFASSLLMTIGEGG